MKKLSNYLLRILAAGGILMMYSCGDDEPVEVAGPQITVSSTDFDDVTLTATGEPGDVVTATISVAAEGGVNVIRVTKSNDAAFSEEVFVKTSGEDGPPSASGTFSYTLVEAEIDETVNFTITAADDTDAGQTATETLTVITEAGETPARNYSAILLAPPLGDKSADTFFSTSTGTIYSPAEVIATSDPVSADIDFGYYEGASTGANLASPKAFDTSTNAGLSAQTDTWGTLNDAEFRTTDLTSSDFLEMTSWEDIDGAFEAAGEIAGPNNIDGLAEGDVVAFQTDAAKTGGAKKGLILVNSITTGAGTTGQIDLDIIVQEAPN